ncbi:MmcQ/YjbR family DNA-binding protein [Adhaeribacter terreus]|uniref:MmcQ/YjbR family DNA-binding protein n=1 Tax=Adhaeribacter terreus TaxID=529703 RepID=A0ABW0EBE8_9BACT
MNIEEYREYCLAKKGVTEGLPFDADTLVFKVGGKMFALTNLSDFDGGIALKCDPEKALQLREEFPDDITGAYHMSKKHWNNVKPNGSVPYMLLKELIDQSYLLVYNGLTRSQKLEVDIENEKPPGLLR